MGSCCQFLSGKRSKLKKENTISYQQLQAIIKPSTHNDHFFYSSHNLSASEEYLGLFSKNSGMQPNQQFIDNNINILINFIRDLRDKSSVVGLQYTVDQQRVNQYIKSQSRKQEYSHNNIVILKLQIQVLLLSSSIIQEIKKQQTWDYFLQIEEIQTVLNNKRVSITSTNNNGADKRIGHIETFWVRDNLNRKIIRKSQFPQKLNESIVTNKQKMMVEQSFMQKNEQNRQSQKKDFQKQHQIQQIPFFLVCSKVVNKYSKIRISFCKDKRKNLQLKQNVNSIQSNKTKVTIGQTNLQVTDFIYHNSLTVSDVVNLNSPQSVNSSFSTSSSLKKNIGVFIALRGQGLQAHTLDKDYIKIIKQHQTVVKQLQFCLQGQKGWQKLSQYKNSNTSQRGQSLYSDYQSAMGIAKYKP